MEEIIKTDAAEPAQTRREFFKTSSQVAVTAPAVAMLLAASTKSAAAASPYGNGVDPVPLDDAADAFVDGFTISDTPTTL